MDDDLRNDKVIFSDEIHRLFMIEQGTQASDSTKEFALLIYVFWFYLMAGTYLLQWFRDLGCQVTTISPLYSYRDPLYRLLSKAL